MSLLYAVSLFYVHFLNDMSHYTVKEMQNIMEQDW